jgi:hypothetical protein
MLNLTASEELVLPLSLERAREVCLRALTELNWSIREQSPTTLVAQEGGFMKWMSNPNDLCVFLSPGREGTRVQLNATWQYGKATGTLLQSVLQGKVSKVSDRIRSQIAGAHAPPHSVARPSPVAPVATLLNPSSAPAVANGRIFISYRRSDSADVTGRIYDRLVTHFGEGSVFQDVEDIPLGMDFTEFIQDVVGKCDAFLAIIGDEWLSATDHAGGRRLDNPADNVRIEIQSALKRQIPLIPVLVRGAEMPTAQSLPASLGALATRNAIRVRPNPDFRSDMTRLIEGLEELFKRKGNSH